VRSVNFNLYVLCSFPAVFLCDHGHNTIPKEWQSSALCLLFVRVRFFPKRVLSTPERYIWKLEDGINWNRRVTIIRRLARAKRNHHKSKTAHGIAMSQWKIRALLNSAHKCAKKFRREQKIKLKNFWHPPRGIPAVRVAFRLRSSRTRDFWATRPQTENVVLRNGFRTNNK